MIVRHATADDADTITALNEVFVWRKRYGSIVKMDGQERPEYFQKYDW